MFKLEFYLCLTPTVNGQRSLINTSLVIELYQNDLLTNDLVTIAICLLFPASFMEVPRLR